MPHINHLQTQQINDNKRLQLAWWTLELGIEIPHLSNLETLYEYRKRLQLRLLKTPVFESNIRQINRLEMPKINGNKRLQLVDWVH